MRRGNDGTTNENNRSTTARIGNRPDRTRKARTPDKDRGYVYTMTHKQYEALRAQIDIADEMFGDLPDGAYWAACEENGVGTDVQIAVDNYEIEHHLGVHSDD